MTMSSTERAMPLTLDDEARWQRAAHEAIQDLVRRDRPFTSADLVKMIGAPPTKSLLPTFMRWARMNRLIVKCAVVTGAVWTGADSDPGRAHLRSRCGLRQSEGETKTWGLARERAAEEKIPTPELVLRALRAYLKSA